MMRWPWTRRLPDPEELAQRDRDVERVAALRRRAEQLTDKAERVATDLEFVLRNYSNRKARGT